MWQKTMFVKKCTQDCCIKGEYSGMRKYILITVVLCLACLGGVACVLFPSKEKIDIKTPAIIVSKETGAIEKTAVQINGIWSYNKLDKNVLFFSGQFRVDALGYTNDARWELEADLVAASGAQYMRGFLPYKTSVGDLESSVIYTDKSHTLFVFYDEDYIVFSPAENKADAHKICQAMGIEFPE